MVMEDRPIYYKLVDRVPVGIPRGDITCIGEAARTVAVTEVGGVSVSTIFLVLDHNLAKDGTRPLLFETMVFGNSPPYVHARYYTWEEAEAGHAQAVASLQDGTGTCP